MTVATMPLMGYMLSNSLSPISEENDETSTTHAPQGLFRFPDEEKALIHQGPGFINRSSDSVELDDLGLGSGRTRSIS
jgi:hypothetical protein